MAEEVTAAVTAPVGLLSAQASPAAAAVVVILGVHAAEVLLYVVYGAAAAAAGLQVHQPAAAPYTADGAYFLRMMAC